LTDHPQQELVERFKRGDRAAFEELIQMHQKTIYGFLRARLLVPDDAEDLVQDVFLRFYLSRDRFDVKQLIRPWLLGIARNLLREHIRKHKRRKEVGWTEMCLDLEGDIESEEGVYEDALRFLAGCMDSLGPSAREAIELKYRKNLRLASIGEKLKRSEGAIKLLMFRARQALKLCLQGKLRSNGHG